MRLVPMTKTMKSHSSPLDELKSALETHNEVLGRARDKYLAKEAERKHFESKLVQGASGKSHAEKLINAQATTEWLEFHKSLARLESVFEFQKLKFSILEKEWQAQYLTTKIDSTLISKQGA